MGSQNTCNGFKKINDDNWIDDNTCMYRSRDNQQCWTERKNRHQKTATFKENIRLTVYKVIAGRKTAIMAITAELEHVKALFNFSNLWPIHEVFACDISKNNLSFINRHNTFKTSSE